MAVTCVQPRSIFKGQSLLGANKRGTLDTQSYARTFRTPGPFTAPSSATAFPRAVPLLSTISLLGDRSARVAPVGPVGDLLDVGNAVHLERAQREVEDRYIRRVVGARLGGRDEGNPELNHPPHGNLLVGHVVGLGRRGHDLVIHVAVQRRVGL